MHARARERRLPPAVNEASPDRPARDPEHEARTVLAVARAHRDVPFYKAKGRAIPEAGARLDEVLAATPLLTRKQVRATLPKQWLPAGRDVRAELERGEVELVETSGTTGERLRVLRDAGWWERQERRAMRVHPLVDRALDGAFGAYREASLGAPGHTFGTCHVGELAYEQRVRGDTLTLNQTPDPTYWKESEADRMLDELARHGTVGLSADPCYLAPLARHAARRGRALAVSGFVALTHAYATASHRRALAAAAKVPILSRYGASEVGTLFVEGDDGLLHHAPFTTHVELLPCTRPTPGAEEVALVVVTTLDRSAQPLVRFVVGDLVQVARGVASSYTGVAPLRSVEGRLDDALVRPDGALVTVGAVDRALAPLADLVDFQLVQTDETHVEANVVPETGASGLEEQVRERLAPLVAGFALDVRTVTSIGAEPNGKLRAVRRSTTFDPSAAFDGAQ